MGSIKQVIRKLWINQIYRKNDMSDYTDHGASVVLHPINPPGCKVQVIVWCETSQSMQVSFHFIQWSIESLQLCPHTQSSTLDIYDKPNYSRGHKNCEYILPTTTARKTMHKYHVLTNSSLKLTSTFQCRYHFPLTCHLHLEKWCSQCRWHAGIYEQQEGICLYQSVLWEE